MLLVCVYVLSPLSGNQFNKYGSTTYIVLQHLVPYSVMRISLYVDALAAARDLR